MVGDFHSMNGRAKHWCDVLGDSRQLWKSTGKSGPPNKQDCDPQSTVASQGEKKGKKFNKQPHQQTTHEKVPVLNDQTDSTIGDEPRMLYEWHDSPGRFVIQYSYYPPRRDAFGGH